MVDLEYYKSERFIWDGLIAQARSGLPGIYAAWKRLGKVNPFIIAWPAEAVLDDNDIPVEGMCLHDLPEDRSLWRRLIMSFARKTKAYALLLVEQRKEAIVLILESHHGTRSWEIPIRLSADRYVLGDAVMKDNAQRIGFLWSPLTVQA